MKLPKEIMVKETLWAVLRKHKINHPELGSNLRGLCEYAEERVTVQTGLDLEETIATFVHEFFHVLSHEYSLKISHDFIYKWEKPIARLIIDNFM